MWSLAEWMAPQGRKAADALAGEIIPFHNEKSKVKDVEGMPPHDRKLVAPLFNLVRFPLIHFMQSADTHLVGGRL